MSFERAISGQIKRMVIEQSADLMRVTIETSDSELSPSAAQENTTSTELPILNVGVMRSKGHLLARRSTSFAMAYMAKHFNINMSFFNAEDIDFENKQVNAIIIENNVRTRKVIPLPKIIDNDIRLFRGETGKSVKTLKDYCYFIRPVDGMTKQRFYDTLWTEGRFKEFLIETTPVDSFKQFLQLIKQYKDVIMKPLHGVGGGGCRQSIHH